MKSSKRNPGDLARAVAGAFKAAKGNEPEAVAIVERLLTKWIDEATREATVDAITGAIGATRGTWLTDAALVAWLRGVEGVAAREGARWRGLRLPGDLNLATTTPDRGRLHLVGVVLTDLEQKARNARVLVDDLRPPDHPSRLDKAIALGPPPGTTIAFDAEGRLAVLPTEAREEVERALVKTDEATFKREHLGTWPPRGTGWYGVPCAYCGERPAAMLATGEGKVDRPACYACGARVHVRIPAEADAVPNDERHYKSSTPPSTTQAPAGAERSSGPVECPGTGCVFAPGALSAVVARGICPACGKEVDATPLLGLVVRHDAPIADCATCEGVDGPGTGNPWPCKLHPKSKPSKR